MKINGVPVEMSTEKMYSVLFSKFGGYFSRGYSLKHAVDAYLSRHPQGSGVREPQFSEKYVAARLYWKIITTPKSLRN